MKHSPSQNVRVKRSALAPITAATAPGAVIDCMGFTRAMVIFSAAPTGAGTTVDANLTAGNAADGSDGVLVPGSAFTQATTAGGASTQCLDVKILASRYLQVPVTGAGGAAGGCYATTVILFNPSYSPVAQDLPAAFVQA